MCMPCCGTCRGDAPKRCQLSYLSALSGLNSWQQASNVTQLHSSAVVEQIKPQAQCLKALDIGPGLILCQSIRTTGVVDAKICRTTDT